MAGKDVINIANLKIITNYVNLKKILSCQPYKWNRNTNCPYFCNFLQESAPMRLDNLNHHVILQILHAMQHPLPQSKRRSIMLCIAKMEFLGNLIGFPDLTNSTFDILAVKQVPEDHLVQSQWLLVEYQRERPVHFVIEGERFYHK